MKQGARREPFRLDHFIGDPSETVPKRPSASGQRRLPTLPPQHACHEPSHDADQSERQGERENADQDTGGAHQQVAGVSYRVVEGAACAAEPAVRAAVGTLEADQHDQVPRAVWSATGRRLFDGEAIEDRERAPGGAGTGNDED